MLTSWSLQSTPAELSMASVYTRPPDTAYSTRPSWVIPRLPPSPTIRARSWPPLTRTPSLARSPTSAWDSLAALTYVPMPPFQSRSTGARKMTETSSLGVRGPSGAPNTARARALSSIDFSVRGYTPPPGEISEAS